MLTCPQLPPSPLRALHPQGFWRNWHASFNQWLVRYLYVPLGGACWRAANVWAVFTFVAAWHDLEWRLLGWAWIMALVMAPEMVGGQGRRTCPCRACVHLCLWSTCASTEGFRAAVRERAQPEYARNGAAFL